MVTRKASTALSHNINFGLFGCKALVLLGQALGRTGALIAFTTLGLAQTATVCSPGVPVGTASVQSVSRAGDFDGDGISDFVILGRVQVLTSPNCTGSLFTTFVSVVSGGGCAPTLFTAAAGPLPNNPAVPVIPELFDVGRSGGDFDGDGFDDVLVISDSPCSLIVQTANVVTVIHGPDGARTTSLLDPLFGHTPPAPTMFGISALAFAGDMTGDGQDEIVVGAPITLVNGVSQDGAVHIYAYLPISPPAGPIASLLGTQPNDQLGYSVAPAGDVNGDGFADILVGAPGNPATTPGRVVVIGGAIQAPFPTLHEVPGPANGKRFGMSLDSIENFDFDPLGKPEFVALGQLTGGGQFAAVIPGDSTGPPIATLTGTFTALRGQVDINGDGASDFMLGDAASNFTAYNRLNIAPSNPFLPILSVQADAIDGVGDVTGDSRSELIRAFAGTFELIAPVSPFADLCNGDGGDQMGCTDCPCSNNNPAVGTVGGCINVAGTSARLFADGSESLSVPANSGFDLGFTLSGAPASALCILSSGAVNLPTNPANPCFGLDSGALSMTLDGLRCAATDLVRVGARVANASGNVEPADQWGGSGAPTEGIGAQGPFAVGQVRYFQVIYRDGVTSGCGRGLNTTQSIRVAFTQ